MMQPKLLLSFTALLETGTGLLLLLSPHVPLGLLLGLPGTGPDTLVVARVAGAALLAIGVASWLARSDNRTPAQLGLLVGILIYNLSAAAILAFAGLGLRMSGVALWPAVVLHAALGVWCVACLRSDAGRE